MCSCGIHARFFPYSKKVEKQFFLEHRQFGDRDTAIFLHGKMTEEKENELSVEISKNPFFGKSLIIVPENGTYLIKEYFAGQSLPK